MTKLDEIKARLAAATTGPWDADDEDCYVFGADGAAVSMTRGWGAEVSGHRREGTQHANHLAIAAYPEDVAWLVAELERVTAERDVVRIMAEALSEGLAAPCPSCGDLVPDLDGFGVLAHCGPLPNACGYCSHPSITDGVCGICGVRSDTHSGHEHAQDGQEG